MYICKYMYQYDGTSLAGAGIVTFSTTFLHLLALQILVRRIFSSGGGSVHWREIYTERHFRLHVWPSLHDASFIPHIPAGGMCLRGALVSLPLAHVSLQTRALCFTAYPPPLMRGSAEPPKKISPPAALCWPELTSLSRFQISCLNQTAL